MKVAAAQYNKALRVVVVPSLVCGDLSDTTVPNDGSRGGIHALEGLRKTECRHRAGSRLSYSSTSHLDRENRKRPCWDSSHKQ